MEHHGTEGTTDVPPIQVIIVKGKEDICVKVSKLYPINTPILLKAHFIQFTLF